jgi:hypothetical protein
LKQQSIILENDSFSSFVEFSIAGFVQVSVDDLGEAGRFRFRIMITSSEIVRPGLLTVS